MRARIGVGIALNGGVELAQQWRLVIASNSSLACVRALFGRLRALLVEGDGVGTGVGVGVRWGRGADVWAYVR